MKVEAIKQGFYEAKLRYPGDVFEVKDEKFFSQRWMKQVSEQTPKRSKSSKSVDPVEFLQVRQEDADVI